MDDNIIDDNEWEWDADFDDTSSLDDNWGEWEGFEFPDDSFVVDASNDLDNSNDIYYLDGYGTIYELTDYLNNSAGVIELLQHSKSKEQFNYILGMSMEESYDEELLNYLKSINYSIEDYVGINVGYQIFKYEELVEYLLAKANEEETRAILRKVGYVSEKIATIVAKLDDRIEIMNSNYHLKDKLVTRKIIQYYKENPNKIDLDVINVCSLDTELINEFIMLGYKISENSPYDILQNNEIMKKKFLKEVEISNLDLFTKLDKEIKEIPGSYSMLYKSPVKEIFNKDFLEVFGLEAVEQMIKYIVLGDYQIDLTKIKGDKLLIIKNIYDFISNDSFFDIQLFTKIIYKYNINPDIFNNFNKESIDENKFKLYFEFKEIEIDDIAKLQNIEEVIYNYEQKKIEASDSLIDIKNVICNLLTNQTYLETRKGLLELGSKEKLEVLKNSIKNEGLAKELDSYIILSDFLENVDKINNVEQLKKIADLINQQILKNGINDKWVDFNKKIMHFYSSEVNERLTDFRKYITDTFYDATDYSFSDGTSVKGKRVNVAHVKSGEEFNSLIHVLNAYQNGGTTGSIESVTCPKFIGQAYISLTGISDEYSRICINKESRNCLKILYSHIPEKSILCASNRDTGINARANSKNIYTRLPANMAPFRRLVRNTEVHGSETYNEYDIFRDDLVPSGIAFMNEEPTEEEINAAAYLGVPLVKIDDLQESFRKDYFSFTRDYNLADDQSFYKIKEHSYEDKKVEVEPNDKYDVIISAIKEEIPTLDVTLDTLDVFSEKDEIGYEEYFVIYNDEKYLAKPVYDYVNLKRVNVTSDYYERCLIKDKLYEILDIKPRETFVNCKYPNGKEVMSLIENTNTERFIDKYLDYLVDIPHSTSSFEFEMESADYIELLKKIESIADSQYRELFESLIKVSNYTEPQMMKEEIMQDKKQLSLVVKEYSQQEKKDSLNEMLTDSIEERSDEDKNIKF